MIIRIVTKGGRMVDILTEGQDFIYKHLIGYHCVRRKGAREALGRDIVAGLREAKRLENKE